MKLSVITLILQYNYMKNVGEHKKTKFEGTNDCIVTDDLLMHSSLPPATKHIQAIKLNYKKRWNLHKNSQTVKKDAAHAKRQHEKSCEIKGDSPEVAVMEG